MADVKYRVLNRDGTDNIDRSELRGSINDLYHVLLSLKWPRFFAATLVVYLFINLLFGGLYFLLGPEGLQGQVSTNGLEFFEECFFFSVQTFSTIGYGRVAPVGLVHNLLVSIEAFTGMLSVAVMSGLLFARFSRPTARVRFSESALITQHRGQRCLVFRMTNSRLNQVSEATVSVTLLKSTVTPEGTSLRIQHDLPLIRNRSALFAASWMVAHVIDQNSPLYGMSAEDFKNAECEILVSLMGYDETFSQTIHSRYSYLWDELVWDRQFADMVTRVNGKLSVSVDKVSELK